MLKFFDLVLFCLCTISYAQDLNEERIVGGNFADIRTFKSHVALLENGDFSCGGSLIKWNWVLTAGHCTYQVTADQLSVRAGSTDSGSGGVKVFVLNIFRQPYFYYNTLTHDISLLKLKASLESYSYNYPIAIISIANSIPAAGSTVVLPGWGYTQPNNFTTPSELRSAYMEVISRYKCQTNYGPLDNSKMCAGIWQGGTGACLGDSGGGLRYNGYLIGVTSYIHVCGEAYFPTVFANAVYMKYWIMNTIDYYT